MKIAAEIALGLLALNGLRVLIGIPPFGQIGRVKACACCKGSGYVPNQESKETD